MKDYEKNIDTDGQCHKGCKWFWVGWINIWIQWRLYGYNEESIDGCFLEVDVQYFDMLHELRNDLPFLSERLNIEKVEKLIANLHDEREYVIHSKQVLNHGLVLKEVHWFIGSNQKPW